MSKPTFLEGVVVAVVASVAGAASFTILGPIAATGLKIVIAVLGLAYALYLVSRSRERTGRVTTIALWMVAAAATWIVSAPLPLYLVIHAGLVWLIRALYFRSSVVPALMDLGLVALGLASAVWAGVHSGSVFLAIWCFFLIQAAFVAIPKSIRGPSPSRGNQDESFVRAHRNAETALRRISITR